MNIKFKIYILTVAVLIFSVFGIWSSVWSKQNQELTVNFFDIGQGDATLIEVAGNFQILIDGGPNNLVLSKLGAAMPKNDKTIELVILSHPDKDHISGLVEVFRRYKIKNVLATLVPHNLADYEEIKNIIKDKSIPIILARAPQRLSWGSGFLEVLYPFEIATTSIGERRTNQTSIVNRLVFGQNSVLFTGDLEKAQELELVLKQIDIRADILKVAHHGSKTSSTLKFLDAVGSEIGIISAGRNNRYKHPHQEVLERLNEKDLHILRTDISGDIVLKSDGYQWLIMEPQLK